MNRAAMKQVSPVSCKHYSDSLARESRMHHMVPSENSWASYASSHNLLHNQWTDFHCPDWQARAFRQQEQSVTEATALSTSTAVKEDAARLSTLRDHPRHHQSWRPRAVLWQSLSWIASFQRYEYTPGRRQAAGCPLGLGYAHMPTRFQTLCNTSL